ncbi:MAG: type II secretion system F family protein [Candidatus Nanoarchaeia archaeon]|nr:type II secretion system F family protein [Candidatus Nanoarchaeia archaeon]
MLDKKQKKKLLQELNIDPADVKRYIDPRKQKERLTEVKYTLYETTSYGRISNSLFENLTLSLTKKYPQFFNSLNINLKQSDIKILSKTYISMMFFSSFIALVSSLAFFSFLFVLLGLDPVSIILRTFTFSFVSAIATLTAFYLYPASVANRRRREIKEDLPFAIIHMSAVAGSGAQPIAMFDLILSSGEYKGLEGEVRKIVNYVNLFGYDLSTALKSVSLTTPSKPFRELLLGIISTVEGGGSLKDYLEGKADEAMTTYRLERKKYVETLSTYSDVYTGILIAAPLLFITTLAIINVLGGKIGGLSVQTLSSIGVYGVIPMMNILFMLFLNITQPEA